MARTAQPNGAGAQFFFGVNENVSLLDEQGIYVKFGEVTEGLDVLVQALESAPADEEPPSPPVTIRSVTIAES
jgi:cyclophilin family peptidyl-prolyl cis-trans isomerase